MTAPTRILVRLPNHLGDVLMARPLLFALRALRPQVAVTAVGPPALLELIARDGTVDQPLGWPLPPGALARLRAERPDVALVLPPSFSSAWFAWRTGARVRIGYPGEGRTPLLTETPRRAERGDRHLADEYLALGESVGARTAAIAEWIPDPPALARAREVLARSPAATRTAHALLGPGALYGPAKRWSAERFTALGRTLAERGLAVLVCGTAAERACCESVAGAIGPAAASLAGATDLPTLAALAALAVVVVSNDSGLAHLAAASGAPTVAVFGSTSSAWTAPLGPRVRIVQRPPVCAPCFQRTCRIGYRCLAAVEVRDVLVAMAELGAAGSAA